MLTVEQALTEILARVQPLDAEVVPLAGASDRILASDIPSPLDLPPFDNSAMDGYAVRASDLASAPLPIALRLQDHVPAGSVPKAELAAGACIRVFTGSLLPSGCDAVVMQEDTRVDNDAPDRVQFLDRIQPWEHVRFRGEDVKSGAVVLNKGDSITPLAIGLLGALGSSTVRVHRRPRVAVVATGNELREPGEALEPGQIYESNRLMLAAMTARTGAVPRIFPIVPDDLEQTVERLKLAFDESDIVITSGGASVGDHDLIRPAIERLGGELGFWRVAMKPGKPFILGQLGHKLLFGLPGNPVSAAVTFLILVRPALLKFQGASKLNLPAMRGVLAEALKNRGDRRHFVRVTMSADGGVRSAGTQASHILGSLAIASGLVDVPPETTFESGTAVSVLRID